MLKKILCMALPLPIFACGPTISVGGAWFLWSFIFGDCCFFYYRYG
jgi:hypothetical protein